MLLTLALWLAAGICLNAAANHFFTGLRPPRNATHLWFAVLCVCAAGIAVFSAQGQLAGTLEDSVPTLKTSQVLIALFFVSLPWFVRSYTGIRWRWQPSILSAVYGVVLVVAVARPYGFAFVDRPTISPVKLPWGEVVSVTAGTMSELLIVFWLMHVVSAVYLVWAASHQYRAGERRQAMALVLSFAVFLLSIAATIVLLLFDIRILVGGTFGFVATVLAMNFALGREIRSRHERVQAVLDNVPMAIWVKGEDMRYVFVNKFYERLFGFKLSQLLGKSDSEVFPEDLRKNWPGNDRRVIATRSSIDVEEQIALGRRVRTIAAVMFPLMDSNDRPYGLGGAALDITDRQRSADAMQALAQPASAEDGDDFYLTCVRQLASTYGASRAFIVLCPESEGRIKTIASWPLDESPLFDGITPEGTACGEVIAHGRLYMDRGAGARFPADATLSNLKAEGFFAAPLISASTRVIGIIGVVSEHRLDAFPAATNLLDAFAKRVAVELDRIAATSALRTLASHLEIRVRERTRELEQLNRELEAFSYSVSHDLRGPLRAIDGFVSLLGEDMGAALGDRSRGHLQRVRGAVKRMSDLIDDLLELAKVTQAQLHAENVDVTALVQQLLARLKEEEPERDVEVDVAPGMSLYGDSRLLHVAIDNLVGNAWKYTGRTAQAKIEAGIYHEDGSAVFYVRDNGVGFDPEYADKLFKVFQRLHTSASFSGTGVGLAIVARIAERHQGRVWAESRPEQGATFYFALPEKKK